jgi:hypothetical protein
VEARGSELRSAESCAGWIGALRKMRVRDVFVVVRDAGEAYYRSDLAPAPVGMNTREFDPLKEILAEAHRAGAEPMRVHAVLNVLLLNRPDNPLEPPIDHLLSLHPEWVNLDSEGYSSDRAGLTWLDPGIPGARGHLEAVVHELASQYALDGIHFAELRHPDTSGGWGYAPLSLQGYREAHELDEAHVPEPRDARWIKWRVETLDSLLALLANAARQARPGVIVSASALATGAPPTSGASTGADFTGALQYWPRWTREGLVDWLILENNAAGDDGRTLLVHWIDFAAAGKNSARIVAALSGERNTERGLRDMAEWVFARKADGVLLRSWQNPGLGLKPGEAGVSALAPALLSPDSSAPAYAERALKDKMPAPAEIGAESFDIEISLPPPVALVRPAPTPPPPREWSQKDASRALLGKSEQWRPEDADKSASPAPRALPGFAPRELASPLDIAPRKWRTVTLNNGRAFVGELTREDPDLLVFLLRDSGATLSVPRDRVAKSEPFIPGKE